MPIADPPVDFAKLDDLTGGDAEFTAELLTTFFASAEQSLDEMQRCLAQADRKQLGRVGHRLKGAAANVHADAVARASAAVEQEAATADPAHLQEMIAALRELLAQVADFAARERPSTNRAA